VEVIPVSEPADASMMDVVPMSPRRSSLPNDDFTELFAATYPQIVRTVWFVIHDRAAAEEVAQDAFTEFFRDWARLRDFDRPDLWVRRVAIHKAQREASRRTRRTILEQVAATGHPMPPSAGDILPGNVVISQDGPGSSGRDRRRM
jgi:DNA-directed RNA polymerase specialized sigma24 family protein